MPTNKTIGEKVIAGSINYDGYIEYEAERIGKEPIAKLADKVSGYFVPAVMLMAIISFIVYLLIGSSFAAALNVFITILVVACPCSLGLATPLAIVVSEGLCAENGILIKKSEILENAQKTDTIVFDKTGTLTYGTLKIANVINYSNMEEKEVLALAGSIEKKGTHPISKAFVDYLEQNNIESFEVENYEEISGYGVCGRVNNEQIILGNSKILSKYGFQNTHKQDEEKLAKAGNSIIYVVKNKEIISIIGVSDIIRKNAKEVINTFNKHKIEVIMLTGDNKESAEKIAKEIGIEKVIANVLPTQKLEVIKKLKQEKRFVLMCGDGINDSPALATADIGVSVNSGTDIAMDSSDVILTRNDLNSIINLIHISKKTIRNIKQNLFWAFFYNILMIPVAIGILTPIGITINPMIASVAMVISSFTVIVNALRLRNIKLN